MKHHPGFFTEEEILYLIEERSRQSTAKVREVIIAADRPDLLKQFDQSMRDLALGIIGAHSTWHSISAAQRRVLHIMGEGRRLRQRTGSPSRFDAIGRSGHVFNVCGLATARALCAHELVHPDGDSVMNPEELFVITERGSFVLRHGQV